jgi:hypothetical protein
MFSKDKRRKDGLCRQCKLCDKRRYMENSESAIKNALKWQAANPEKVQRNKKAV